MNKFVHFLRCPRERRILLFRALILLWLCRIGLWLLPFRTLQTLISVANSNNKTTASVPHLTSAIETVSSYVPNCSCLVRALVAHRLLCANGFASQLIFGVAQNSQEIEAHAWVEVNGVNVFRDSVTPYARLTEAAHP